MVKIKQKAKTGVLGLNDYIITTVIALFSALGSFASYNPLFQNIRSEPLIFDSSCFLVIGRGMLEGKMPYIDYYDNKGPVLYILNAIPQIFSKSIISNYVFIWLLLFLSLLLIRYIGIKCRMRYPTIAQLGLVIFNAALMCSGGYSEEYSVTFTLAVFALVFKYTEDESKQIRFHYGFIIGLMFALAALTRYNNAIAIGVVTAVLAIYLVVKKEFANLARCALSFICGAGIVCAGSFGYLAAFGALKECINLTLLLNLNYVSASKSVSNFFASDFGITETIVLSFSIIGAAVFIKNRRKQSKEILIPVCVLASSIICFIVSMLSVYRLFHYILLVAAPACVGVAMLNSRKDDSLCDKPTENKFVHLRSATQSAVTALLVIMLFANYYSLIFTVSSVFRAAQAFAAVSDTISDKEVIPTEDVKMIRDIASHIPDDERNSVFSIGVNPCWYVWTDLQPCKRLFVCADMFMEMSEETRSEMFGYFTGDDIPKWLVTSAEIENFKDKDLAGTLSEKYILECSAEEAEVWLYRLDAKK